mgnify:CR=1 FL=1
MSNVELYCKVQNVIMSCKNLDQLEVARRYATLAQKVLTHEWNMDVIQLVVAKERLLTCR